MVAVIKKVSLVKDMNSAMEKDFFTEKAKAVISDMAKALTIATEAKADTEATEKISAMVNTMAMTTVNTLATAATKATEEAVAKATVATEALEEAVEATVATEEVVA